MCEIELNENHSNSEMNGISQIKKDYYENSRIHTNKELTDFIE
jgi:hypothetical protein